MYQPTPCALCTPSFDSPLSLCCFVLPYYFLSSLHASCVLSLVVVVVVVKQAVPPAGGALTSFCVFVAFPAINGGLSCRVCIIACVPLPINVQQLRATAAVQQHGLPQPQCMCLWTHVGCGCRYLLWQQFCFCMHACSCVLGWLLGARIFTQPPTTPSLCTLCCTINTRAASCFNVRSWGCEEESLVV